MQYFFIATVSTFHRAKSFDVFRWVIATLKKQVTIWKKKVWNTGDESWVEPK